MIVSMAVLAGGCVAVGLLAPVAVRAIEGVVISVAGVTVTAATPAGAGAAAGAGMIEGAAMAVRSLRMVVLGSAALLLLASILILVRRLLLAKRRVETGVTWDCGYAAPTPRMQYTASGFAQPLTSLFAFALRTHRVSTPIKELFPTGSALSTHTPDPMHGEVYQPAFEGVGRLLSKQKWVQSGQMQLYILYIAVTLLLLLVWKLP